ncbi:hypothetical protein GE09DRAFT_1203703 [Coniochaeta sp. 2T2.1]|nr:hypothetical protein GE09DRAFT_1203703 [Coniochaeta sp. 2T2.1]
MPHPTQLWVFLFPIHIYRINHFEPLQNAAPKGRASTDLNKIWQWNASVPEPVQGCVHDMIHDIATTQPRAMAVCAWDGEFTYSELDTLANLVAYRLIGLGCAQRSSIPILFSKSKWTCVAMLGVVKAGCSAIVLDATQPDTRLRSIVQQASPPAIVSSASHRNRASLLANVSILQLDEMLLDTLRQPIKAKPPLPMVQPSDLVYISFTSGTTGQPKGACISHSNVTSAVHYQGQQLGFHHGCRVFDFAPYSFDVAWSNFLHTLCAGGCLCIASEDEMLMDLYSAIVRFTATLINVTPTVLRTLSKIPPGLQTVLLSGEMPYRDNITQWAGHVRLLNTYGPTECTFKSAFSILHPTQEARPDIGRGVGFATWIVDPSNDRQLVSIGSVGELYLEGPLVGQGYLSDPAQTASAFIYDPPWLLDGSVKGDGRCGRLYKTGDLVKYKPDGTLLFVGRKDADQHKIRGQRIALGDVEHHARACLDETPPAIPVIADVIRPRNSDSNSLALFVVVENEDRARLKAVMDGLEGKMRQVLPGFMIPSVYLPIQAVPVGPTGKVDRRRLREMAAALTSKELIDLQSTILSTTEFQAPSNRIEVALSQIWSEVLGLDSASISRLDSFLRLGGDSIAAMRVVAEVRGRDLSLTVADLFRTPVLKDLARATKTHTVPREAPMIEPFALLIGASENRGPRESAARLCGVGVDEVEDIYPCTPLQEGMLAVTAAQSSSRPQGGTDSSRSEMYVSSTAFQLPGNTDRRRFEKAWSRTLEAASILRTRIINLAGHGLVQVVLTRQSPLRRHAHIDDFAKEAKPMGLGMPLCRAGLITSAPGYFVLEMHHAIFDGWSTQLILEALEGFYSGGQEMVRPFSPSQPFIKHVLAAKGPETASFWLHQLQDSEATTFPSPNHRSGDGLDVSHSIRGLRWPQTETTPSTAVHAALSLLLATYTNSSDIKYGATVSGRGAAVPGIEDIAAPTIATLPVRVRVDWNQTMQDFQQQLQQQMVDMTEHEQFGLQNIQRINEEIKEASQFQLLLVVQPSRRKSNSNSTTCGLFAQPKTLLVTLVAKDGQTDSIGMHNSYAMMMVCQLETDGLTLNINFDSGAIDQKAVRLFAAQLEHLVRQLCTATPSVNAKKLGDMSFVSDTDLAQIWHWNRVLPDAVGESVISMVDDMTAANHGALAITAWDSELTYQQLKDLTTALAGSLHRKGVRAGSVVVLSLEKSSWMVVGMLSTFRIGAIVVPLSAPTSSQRAQDIVAALRPLLVVTSDESDAAWFSHFVSTYSISDMTQDMDQYDVSETTFHANRPSEPALILSTSGSTGVPKSILWSHGNLSSNVRAHAVSMDITSTSRVFQFAGYEFDVSTVEALSTLCAGGCLCIPSESDRINHLADTVRDSNANWLCLTPSVAETIKDPHQVPAITTLVLTGEKLPHRTAFKWVERVSNVYNWYGPAEASVATTCLVQKHTWKPGMIGRSTNMVLTWLVSLANPDRLAPIGAIAELWLEGPITASYTGHADDVLLRNEQALLSPLWLSKGHGDVPGRKHRVYRTGDLVKYDADGNLILLGRKHDSQRKLRGHRIDLGEVEACVQAFLLGKLELDVQVEICTPGNGSAETLVLFISPSDKSVVASSTTGGLQSALDFVRLSLPTEAIEEYLLGRLPSYMVPKVYIPIEGIPINPAGKTDRRRLREIGSAFTYEQLAAMQPVRQNARKPTTAMEKRLQQLWAETMGIEQQAIYANHNFFRLGGDSVIAMRLVASGRQKGLLLTVKMVFDAPQLEEMAKRATVAERDGKTDCTAAREVPPFSLLNGSCSEADARSLAARLCNVPESRIEDMYPCTALQEGLLALGVKRPGQYVSRSVLTLQAGIEVAQLKSAWSATVNKMTLLRTRIVDIPGQGFVQVILDALPLRAFLDIGSDLELEDYVRRDEQEPMGPGTDLCRAAIIGRNFVLTIHHCTYDGNTLRMMLAQLDSQYHGKSGMSVTQFKNFIQQVATVDPQEAADFWKRYLSSAEARQFPLLPSASYEPQASEEVVCSISLDWPRIGITPSSILRSAWALLATQYTSADQVIFAITVDGRQVDMPGIENCAGPTISTMPVVVTIDRDETTAGFMARLQREMVQRTPYEQYGLQNLRPPRGTLDHRLLQTLFVVQPVAEGKHELDKDGHLFRARSFASNKDTLGVDPFNSYALMVVCQLATSGLRLRMSFDNSILDAEQIRRMTRQFETIIRQLCSEDCGTMKVGTIQTASDKDLNAFWSQNAELPPAPDRTVIDMIRRAVHGQPHKVAIDAWDGQFTYQQVDQLSTVMARNLVSQGLPRGSVVCLHFEKSRWVPVVQLATFKAGAADVLLSISVPDLRVARVFANLGVKFAIASDSRVAVVARYARGFTVDELLQKTQTAALDLPALPALDMGDAAAILVSSGSTGEPKQILWSHRGIAANVQAHGEYLGVRPSSRIFQFASYDFDVATIESMSALAHGATLCIPSETERLNGTAAAINRSAASFVNITPSTARALDPDDVPTIDTLVLSGENLLQRDVDRWKGRGLHVLNWYGAAEHPSTVCRADTDSWYSGVIGSLHSRQPTLSWLVDLESPNRLVPLGAVGEIASEGPLSSDGYVANPTLQAQRFRRDPAFLVFGRGNAGLGRGGRRGVIFCSGDLGRYDSHGRLRYMGRKDAQVKIRGQLVAPEEVQHQIRTHMTRKRGNEEGEEEEISVVVDAVQLHKHNTNLTLVAFLNVATDDEVQRATAGLDEKLKRVLPPYAIPAHYIPVKSFPTNASAKIDRRRLREIGAAFGPSLSQSSSSKNDRSTRSAPTTTAQRALRELWCRALSVHADDISANDSFLQFGDSVSAMRLAGLARQQGFLLTVAEIFHHPTLEDMSKILRNLDRGGGGEEEEEEEDATSLLTLVVGPDQGPAAEVVREQAASGCGVGTDEVQDVFPCTPLQEGLLALTMKREGDYVGNTILQLAPDVDLLRFAQAWNTVASTIDILCTRIIDLPGHGLVQVLLQGRVEESHIEVEGIHEYLEKQGKLPIGLGSPLMRYGLFADSTVGTVSPSATSEFMLASWGGGSSRDVEHGTGSKHLQYFALTLHHSIYDGLTMPLILDNLEAVYNGAAPLHHRPFRAFVKYIGNRDKTAEVDFWRARFQDLQAAQFPALPSSTYYPRTDSSLMYVVERVGWRRDNITPSTVIRAALALLLLGGQSTAATTTTSADVVFGEVVAGRQVPMPGIDRVAGPTIATIPVRVTVDRQANSTKFLAALQLDAIERVPYEQTGLSRIRQISDEARQACEFQTLLVVQMPEEEGGGGREGNLFRGEVRRRGAEHDARYHGFQTYPLSLICTPDTRTDKLQVRVCFDSAVVGREAVARMAQDLELLLRRLCSPDLYGASLGQVTSTREKDLTQIWKWNSEVFPGVDRCVHELVSEIARAQPDVTAIRGWDGILTYGQLDRASTRVALRLREMGIQQGQVVPICSEKSVYALVALLGVSKAGGGGLMLDTMLPEDHLGRVIKGTNSGALILSSISKEGLASRLGAAVVVLYPDSDLIQPSAAHDGDTSVGEEQLPTVDPTSCFSIILTSGSTGREKYAVVQHRNISSAVFHQRSMLRLDHNSMLYDAAPSHASVAAYWGGFHVLATGGTLCIPSEDEVEKDLEESIGRYGATDIFLTPLAARTLDPAKAAASATLRNVYLGGQQVTTHDTARWLPHVEDVLVVYGVAECAPAAMYSRARHNTTMTPTATTPLQLSSTIGRGIGVSTWVVDAQNSERLVPIGTVGELCLEGPLVGLGYLHNNNNDDGQQSATADFIESPSWLLKGSPDGVVPGRSGRVFKTGDLVRYEPTSGQIIYVGKTDGQHMLRGQRVDLAQVEHHVRCCIGAGSSEESQSRSVVAAEIVVPHSVGKPTLVAFISAAALAMSSSQMSLREIQMKLQGYLPAHMVPTGYRVVESIPSLASGKTDRRRLREMGTRLSADELAVGQQRHASGGGLPTTDSELRLQQLWSTLLDTPADRILKDSNFVHLGGDSIYAMRLTSLARRKGISLTVHDILQHPQLFEMASAMTLLPSSSTAGGRGLAVRPFSLLRLPSKKAAAIYHVARQCGVDASHIQDIFPCTSVQKSLLSMTARSAGSYVARYSLRLRPEIDLARLKEAWVGASRVTAPILRYRIVDVPDEGLVQVQIDEPPQWDEYDDIDTCLKCEDGQSMGLDTPLTRLAVVRERDASSSSDETQKSSWRCYITQHHAIYDGYSVGLLLEEVSKAYSGVVDDDVAPVATFQAFIQHSLNVERDDALNFWRQQFAGTIRRNMADLEWQGHASKSAVIRAAWAVLVAHYTRSDDVLLGAMVSGRQVPLAGVDRTIAPLISAVPLRIRVDPKESVDKLLQYIQGQSIAMTAYEQTELLEIRRVSAEADVGTRFNMLLVVNPPEERNGDVMRQGPFLQDQPMGDVSNRDGELDDFNPNAVMIMCHLGDANVGLRLDISFDSYVVPAKQMERMVAQFEHVLRQLNDTSALQRPVEDISAISKQDIAQLWTWNSPLPKATARCVHDLIGDTMQRQPQAPAICAWDGNLSYSELDTLSASLARHLKSLGMGPGSIVPLCFEKSVWYTVAALGVMRAGAACIAMDSTQPESRLRSIVQQVLPRFILASSANQDLASRLSHDAVVIVVSHDLTIVRYGQQQGPTTGGLPAVSPSDVLYVVFTSGSTGVPKGIVTTHQNFASAATHQSEVLRIRPGIRVFDFVSYNFDVSWSNHLQTLICGACLCVPSEQERRDDIASAFNRMGCDYAYFTPSVVQSLDPSALPGLSVLAMGGEPLQSREAARWPQLATDGGGIIGIYGPAECAQAVSFMSLQTTTTHNNVGHSFGARTWLVEPGRPDRLAAIGTIGELMIEGPTVSSGYFADPAKTAAAYIQDPAWLTEASAAGHTGRKGTLFLSGDLLRYNPDGSLTFMGRKDDLVKLRGQRIELGEVEHYVRSCLRDASLCAGGIAAEIITPRNSTSALLVVFFGLARRGEEELSAGERETRLSQVVQGLEDKLWHHLPQYMIPGAYIPLANIPMTMTNKTDRRALRNCVSSLTLEELARMQQSTAGRDHQHRRPPSTTMETRLQALWAAALEIDPNSISADSSFLRIGGESIAAMRLVAKARAQRLPLTVRDIFKTPRLSEQALLVTETMKSSNENINAHSQYSPPPPPFSLLKSYDSSRETFLAQFVMPVIDRDNGTVADVMPATDFQSLAVTQALQDPPSRYPHWILDLPVDTDFARLERACVELVSRLDILRTVFVRGPRNRYWQVVLNNGFKPAYMQLDAATEKDDDDIAAFTDAACEQDLLTQPRRLGRSFVRFIAIRARRSGLHKLVFRISHAQFDGFSWPTVLRTLSNIYCSSSSGEHQTVTPTFGQYMAVNDSRRDENIRYWTSRLQGSSYPRWSGTDPTNRLYGAEHRLTVQECVPMPDMGSYDDGISTATLFHAACAVALSRTFKQREVIFGRLVTGRTALPGYLQDVVGPTMTEVPVRVVVDADNRSQSNLAAMAAQLQDQLLEDSRYEAIGMVEIASRCTDWGEDAVDFGWRTSFQQQSDGNDASEFKLLGVPSRLAVYQRDMPARSRPEVYATPTADGMLGLEVEANACLMSKEVVTAFLATLQALLASFAVHHANQVAPRRQFQDQHEWSSESHKGSNDRVVKRTEKRSAWQRYRTHPLDLKHSFVRQLRTWQARTTHPFQAYEIQRKV